MVLHSPWSIEEHWGRLFEIEKLVPYGFLANAAASGQDDHGAVTLRKRPGPAPTADELERIDPAERREAAALLHDVRQLRAENASIRVALDGRPPPQREAGREINSGGDQASYRVIGGLSGPANAIAAAQPSPTSISVTETPSSEASAVSPAPVHFPIASLRTQAR